MGFSPFKVETTKSLKVDYECFIEDIMMNLQSSLNDPLKLDSLIHTINFKRWIVGVN